MELRRGAPCVRPHFWHRYEVTVVSRGVDGCMSVVTVTIADAQSLQTGAGNLRAMHVIGSTDISESKQHYPRNNAKARRNVPSVEFNLLTGRRLSRRRTCITSLHDRGHNRIASSR
jgi:hypothetical protein